MITTPLSLLDQLLRQRRPDYYAALQPGASPSEWTGLESLLACPMPAAFFALYAWRNGQHPECSVSLQGNRMFMSLDEIVETKEMLDEMIGTDFEDPRYWRRGWVPFLSNGGGSYLCVDLCAEDGGIPGQLIGFWKGDSDRPAEYSSMDAWLAKLVSSLAAKR